jgi:hypothetical protein
MSCHGLGDFLANTCFQHPSSPLMVNSPKTVKTHKELLRGLACPPQALQTGRKDLGGLQGAMFGWRA